MYFFIAQCTYIEAIHTTNTVGRSNLSGNLFSLLKTYLVLKHYSYF